MVSEDEDTMVTIAELDCQHGSVSKGSSKKRCFYSISLQQQKTPKTTSAAFTNVLLPHIQDIEILC